MRSLPLQVDREDSPASDRSRTLMARNAPGAFPPESGAQAPQALNAEWVFRTARCQLLVPLDGFVVGRGPLADLRIEDDSVSRRHALFRIGSDGLPSVQDLGSSNGTFVNDRRIAGRTVLAEGDVVELGSYRLEFVASARRAHENEPTTREMRRAELPGTRDRSLDGLSPRERELFGLLARGLSQRELSQRLGVSIKTVQTHRTRIGQKLGVRSRAELVGLALEVGVLKPAELAPS